MSWLPGLKGFVGSTTHLTSGQTVVEQIGVLPSYMVMVSPGVPVPLIDGLVSPVAPPEGIGMPLSSVMPLMMGLLGTLASTLKPKCTDAGLAVPAAFVSVADRSCAPLVNAFAGCRLH